VVLAVAVQGIHLIKLEKLLYKPATAAELGTEMPEEAELLHHLQVAAAVELAVSVRMEVRPHPQVNVEMAELESVYFLHGLLQLGLEHLDIMQVAEVAHLITL
jgi:hypothetical protein